MMSTITTTRTCGSLALVSVDLKSSLRSEGIDGRRAMSRYGQITARIARVIYAYSLSAIMQLMLHYNNK
jgi:hypothetical protein